MEALGSRGGAEEAFYLQASTKTTKPGRAQHRTWERKDRKDGLFKGDLRAETSWRREESRIGKVEAMLVL